MAEKKKSKLDNLKVIRSETQARELGKKGGIASGKARKEKKLLSQILMEKLAERIKATGKTHGETIIDALIGASELGDVKAAKEVFDRTEGKAIQQIQVEGNVSVANALLAARKRLRKQGDDE